MTERAWEMALGATVTADGVRFAVWAPDRRSVSVVLSTGDASEEVPLRRDEDGVWRGEIAGIGAGTRYRYRVDGGQAFPDPRSRSQPEGVHGPSEVVDPTTFPWTDAPWTGPDPATLVIYELHVGTFTPEGSFAALTAELPELKRLGITAIELMPVAECAGRWNWGYDGVDLYAPSHHYGTPDDLRRLVDAAHVLGIAVFLDVVYNHLGPEGNYLRQFSERYFSERYRTAWGEGLNWDGEDAGPVRQFVMDNAAAWIAEYHIDGLRLDATHTMADASDPSIIREIAECAREVAAQAGRRVVMIAEEGRHEILRTRPVEEGGDGLDAIWADDFHHETRVALTNAHENYYAWYAGTTNGIARAINQGLVLTDRHPKSAPIEERDPASAFIFCIQNHDQVGNRPYGDRLHHEVNAKRYAVVSTLLLTSPETPLLFMGQEFAASTPFLYFTDHPEALGRQVTAGRREEFSGFRAFHDPYLRETIPDPQAESTFRASKLHLQERLLHAGVYELYRELLRLRRDDPVLSQHDRAHTRASAPSAQIVAIHRWWGAEQRLVLANLGHAIDLEIAGVLDLTLIQRRAWTLRLATSELRFGGTGEMPTTSGIGTGRVVHLPARTAAIWSIAD